MTVNKILNVVIEPSAVDIIVQAIHDSNKKMTETIIEQMVKHNLESTLKLVEDILDKNRENERLYTLKDLSKLMNIGYRSLLTYNLPYHKVAHKNQKMYRLSEIREYLRK